MSPMIATKGAAAARGFGRLLKSGIIEFESTNASTQGFNGTYNWAEFNGTGSFTISGVSPSNPLNIILVAGGGAGGDGNAAGGGGGGGGGVVKIITKTLPDAEYDVVIGAGGAARDKTQGTGGPGFASYIRPVGSSSYVYYINGGGGGGSRDATFINGGGGANGGGVGGLGSVSSRTPGAGNLDLTSGTMMTSTANNTVNAYGGYDGGGSVLSLSTDNWDDGTGGGGGATSAGGSGGNTTGSPGAGGSAVTLSLANTSADGITTAQFGGGGGGGSSGSSGIGGANAGRGYNSGGGDNCTSGLANFGGGGGAGGVYTVSTEPHNGGSGKVFMWWE